MNAEFKARQLGDLVEISKGVSYKGAYLDKAGPSLFGLGVVLPGGGFRKGKARSYGGPFKPRHVVKRGDLFLALTDITQDGSVLGSPVLVPDESPDSLITHHVAALRTRNSRVTTSKFLYYALRSESSRSHFRGMATGTTVRAVSVADAASVVIPIPSIAVQHRVVKILGGLDEKIELLERTNSTLEAIGQSFFLMSFLARYERDDMFFGASDAADGYRYGTLDELVDFDPRLPLRKGDESVYLDMKSVPTEGPSVTDWSSRAFSGGTRFQQNDTLLARITPCLENGKSALVDFLLGDEVAHGSTEFIVLRPKDGVPRTWPYYLVRYEPFRSYAIANMTGSDGRQRVSATALASYRLAIPPRAALRDFGERTESLFRMITNNTRLASTLRALRDLLLPKLVSGELNLEAN